MIKEVTKVQEKYLGEIFIDNNVKLDVLSIYHNILMFAPTNCGKSTLIKQISNDERHLVLTDNNGVKLKCGIDGYCDYFGRTLQRTKDGTLQWLDVDEKLYKTHDKVVMTYSQFGSLISDKAKEQGENLNVELDGFTHIHCDEIHNLFTYQTFDDKKDKEKAEENKKNLQHVVTFLFRKYANIKIFMYTATPTKAMINYISKVNKDILYMFNFTKFDVPGVKYWKDTIYFKDYLHEVKTLKEKNIEKFNHKSEIVDIIKAHMCHFKEGKKCLIYTNLIKDAKAFRDELNGLDDINCMAIWGRNAVKNNKDHKLDVDQEKFLCHLISKELIPDEYNVVIINRAYETGINIKNKDVFMAITNTTDEVVEYQARSRVRVDIDYWYKRSKDDTFSLSNSFDIIEKYLDRQLTKKDKDTLCEELNIKDKKGRLVKWNRIKELLEDEGFEIIDNKPIRDKETKKVIKVSYISINW